MDGCQRSAERLKSFAHPVRLQFLDLLGGEGEGCVCHLEARLGQRQAYVWQQLAKLREAGLVAHLREGLNAFYRLAVEEVAEVLEAAFGCPKRAILSWRRGVGGGPFLRARPSRAILSIAR